MWFFFIRIWCLFACIIEWKILFCCESKARVLPLGRHCNNIFKRNVNNTHFNVYFSIHFLLLVKIHIGPTKFIWNPHDLVGLMWILTNHIPLYSNINYFIFNSLLVIINFLKWIIQNQFVWPHNQTYLK